MTCDANVKTSKQYAFLARNDLDTAWEIVGGIKDFSYEGGAPTEDTTSSSTIGDFQTNQGTGYKTFSMTASGICDESTGVEPVTGLNIVGANRLSDLWFADGSCGEFQVQDVDTGGTITGKFIISQYSKSAARPGLVNFSASFTNEGIITKVGDI